MNQAARPVEILLPQRDHDFRHQRTAQKFSNGVNQNRRAFKQHELFAADARLFAAHPRAQSAAGKMTETFIRRSTIVPEGAKHNRGAIFPCLIRLLPLCADSVPQLASDAHGRCARLPPERETACSRSIRRTLLPIHHVYKLPSGWRCGRKSFRPPASRPESSRRPERIHFEGAKKPASRRESERGRRRCIGVAASGGARKRRHRVGCVATPGRRPSRR